MARRGRCGHWQMYLDDNCRVASFGVEGATELRVEKVA